MDIAKSFTFITEDERYIEKLAFGVGLILISMLASFALIGVAGFFILNGYCLRLLQNVRDGQAKPLPEWNQWGDDLVRGLKLWVAQLVWGLPAVLFVVPTVVGAIIADQGGGSDVTEGLGVAFGLFGICLVFLYSLFVMFAAPGMTIAFAKREQIRDALQITPIWHWTRQNLGQVAVSVVVLLAASFAIGLAGTVLGTLLCLVGLVVTVPLAALVTSLFAYHLYGQLAHEYPLELNGW